MTGIASGVVSLSKRKTPEVKKTPLASFSSFLLCKMLTMPRLKYLQHVLLSVIAPGVNLFIGLHYPTAVTVVQESIRVLLEVEKFVRQLWSELGICCSYASMSMFVPDLPDFLKEVSHCSDQDHTKFH